VRGIWEDSHAGRGKFSEHSLRYKGVRLLENAALKGADACCAICEGLRQEIESRGIPRDKIFLVPNGVDSSMFMPGEPDETLRKDLGVEAGLTIGYIGSFFHYEGLDILVRGLSGLVQEFPRLRLLMVGDGELMPVLRKIAQEEALTEHIVFTGRVPHEEVVKYYRVCDFFVLPRKETRETLLVTPLKPLEIMAMGKAVIASNIGGHREIVEDGMNGLMFKSEDLEDLRAKCRKLLTDPESCVDLGARSREWVVEHRDWSVLVERYIELYSKLSSGGGINSGSGK
ncbi:glycosyltransferase, partial [Thermodesulfobacteriota bacterium]